ncbi:MAG: DUF1501 domain-containing protein [Lautropia sp.]
MAAALPLSKSGARLFAAERAPARLLLVFLRGGYDAASLLIPRATPFYRESRPNIAIADPEAGGEGAALALDRDWALHPALAATMQPLYEQGQLAFIPFAGTDDLSRSHFETQDGIELGLGDGAPRAFRSGFMNRLAAQLQGSEPIAFTAQLPLTFRGPVQVPNVALDAAGRDGISERQRQLITAMYQDTPLAERVREGFDVRGQVAREIGEQTAANRNAVTARGFEAQARQLARLMRERYRLAFVDVGGWDTHVGQGNATGYLANRLAELGRGLSRFAVESGPVWRDTVVVVVSEFGRTFRENGNRGTDHGHGTVYWVLGGSINGGRIVGEQVGVAAATLFQNRDYPVLNEYRALLGGLMMRVFGLDAARIGEVFPGVAARDLALV